jgi:hypothetical protein
VPLLPEARTVLPAALVHEQPENPLQGIQRAVQLLSQSASQARAAWVEQQQQQQTSQQQGKAGKQQKHGNKQVAKSAGSSSSSSVVAGADYTWRVEGAAGSLC